MEVNGDIFTTRSLDVKLVIFHSNVVIGHFESHAL